MRTMIGKLKSKSEEVGFKMNMDKCKIISNLPEPALERISMEVTKDYVYLGHKIIDKEDRTAEETPLDRQPLENLTKHGGALYQYP